MTSFRVASIVCLLGQMACSTQTTGQDGDGTLEDSSGEATAADSGATPTTGAADTFDPDETTGGPAPPAAPPSRLRRLTRAEYARSMQALTGLTVDVQSIPDDPVIESYDNDAALLTVSALHFDGYVQLARQVADSVAREPERRAAIIGCEPTGADRAACHAKLLTGLGRRVFRRPLTDEESATLMGLGDAVPEADDPYAGLQLMLEALLSAPSFLFRSELGSGSDAVRPLDAYEHASKLAFFLWAEPPDDPLLDAAGVGALADPDQRAMIVEAMLADPRARVGLERFTSQWLRLRELDGVIRDAGQYPGWSEQLRTSAREETVRFVAALAWSDADFLDIYTAKTSFVDATLAALYGVEAPPDGFAEVDLPADRVGLLTQASVLNLGAPTWGVAPILRGKYVRDVVLCQPPPPPPANIPPLPPPDEVSSERERLETHSTNAECSGCHVTMDPIGFGFERYDVIGATREVDLYGVPLTGAGALQGHAPEAFTGPAELAARLHDLPEARRCVVQQAWRYAGGRSVESYDTASLDPLAAAFAEAPRFVDLIASIATSPGFAEARMPEGVCQ